MGSYIQQTHFYVLVDQHNQNFSGNLAFAEVQLVITKPIHPRKSSEPGHGGLEAGNNSRGM